MTDLLAGDRSSEELATLIAEFSKGTTRSPLSEECRLALDELHTRCNSHLPFRMRDSFQAAWLWFLEHPDSWLAYLAGNSRGNRSFKAWFRGVLKNRVRANERNDSLAGIKGFPALATENCKPLPATARKKIHGLIDGVSLEDEIRFRMRNQPSRRECDLVDERVKLRRFEKPELVSARTKASCWQKKQWVDELNEMWEFVDRECDPELRWALKMRYKECRTMADTVTRLAAIGFHIKPSTLQSRINKFIERARRHFQDRTSPDKLAELLGLDASLSTKPERNDGIQRLFRLDGAQSVRGPRISHKNTRNASQKRDRH